MDWTYSIINYGQEETSRSYSHQDVLVAWTKLTALIKQQTTSVNTIFKLIWTYGLQLWGTASTSNIEILERFQSKALNMIVDAQWYVPNTLKQRDLQIPSVKEEIRHYSSHYSALLTAHPNDILLTLLEPPERKRLRHHLPNDLPTRFMV
jgi:hypothetical protein